MKIIKEYFAPARTVYEEQSVVRGPARTSLQPPAEPVVKIFIRAPNDPSVFIITEKTPTRVFSCLNVPISALTFKKTLIKTLY